MKSFYSQRITNSLDADAEKSFEGKWIKLNFHETSLRATFLLKRNEVETLRDFLNEALMYSEPGAESPKEDAS